MNGNKNTVFLMEIESRSHELFFFLECDSADWTRFVMVYLFPIVLVVCLFGNSMNILVYRIEYLRKSLAVKMLAVKGLATIKAE